MKDIRGFETVIEPFEERHAKEVLELIVGIQQNEFGISISASDQPDLINISDFYRKGRGNFWVATYEGRVVGTIALLDIGGRMAALRKMFVDASFRGKERGVAYALLQALISWSEGHDIQVIYLGTTPKFLAAHAFYEKNDFVEIQKRDLPETFPVMKVDRKFYKFEVR